MYHPYTRCISYYSYIKPQHRLRIAILRECCISYYSYIKPQRSQPSPVETLVVYRTIPTSNHNCWPDKPRSGGVVYRTIPTSNHNWAGAKKTSLWVVYRTIPTSNHNSPPPCSLPAALYIVLFLHQTTTGPGSSCRWEVLYIVLFLHQTTTPLERESATT